MTGFPPPPGSNRTKPPPLDPPRRAEPPVILAPTVVPPATAPDPRKMTDEETMSILRTHLKPSQYQDPQILHFIACYMQTRHAQQAAADAGYSAASGYNLRTRPEIHRAIEELTAKMVQKYGYNAEEIIERVKEISAVDPIEFENPDGSFKTNMSQISPEVRRAIKKFKVKNLWGKDANDMSIVIGQIIDIELYDKLKAHELLAREKGVLRETKVVQHDVTTNMKDLLLDSSRRAEQRLVTGAIDVTPPEEIDYDADET